MNILKRLITIKAAIYYLPEMINAIDGLSVELKYHTAVLETAESIITTLEQRLDNIEDEDLPAIDNRLQGLEEQPHEEEPPKVVAGTAAATLGFPPINFDEIRPATVQEAIEVINSDPVTTPKQPPKLTMKYMSTHCPNCGNNDIEKVRISVSGASAVAGRHCNSCGYSATWPEWTQAHREKKGAHNA